MFSDPNDPAGPPSRATDPRIAPLRGFYPQRGGSMGIGPFQPGLLGGPYETPGYGHGAGGHTAYSIPIRRPGPRGYTRPDDIIRDDIVHRLIHDTDIELGEMEVNVENGRVTLSGHVPTRDDRLTAEAIAHHVRGVTDITNNLTPSPRDAGS